MLVRTEAGGEYQESEVAAAFRFGEWLNLQSSSRGCCQPKDDLPSPDNRQLIAAATKSRQQERERIAADLHDGIAQMLLTASYDNDVCRTMLAMGQTASLKDSLTALKRTLQQCIQETRRTIADLKPPQVEKYGLVGALRMKASQLTSRGLNCLVNEKNPLPPLSDEKEKAVYWIVEEALNNARKHAGASRVSVAIEMKNGVLSVTVNDDGHGFYRTDASNSSAPPSFGLTSMETRARMINGRLTVTSEPGLGTEVKLSL